MADLYLFRITVNKVFDGKFTNGQKQIKVTNNDEFYAKKLPKLIKKLTM